MAAATTDSSGGVSDVDAKAVAEHLAKTLRSSPVMQGDRRVNCFSAEVLIKHLRKSKHKSLACVKTEEDAVAVARSVAALNDPKCMYRVNVELRRQRLVASPIAKTGFSSDPTSMYVWCYKGSQTFNHLMLAGILLAVLLVCLFPVWPRWGKLGALALAAFTLVALVGSIFGRWLLWLVCWLFGYDVWFLPNVFGVGESYAELFLPWWSVEAAPKGDRVYRLVTLVGILAFAYWVYTQPTKFDAFIASQREFVTDLYNGAFVADKSEDARQNMDGDLPPQPGARPNKDTFESLFDDLVGSAPRADAGGDDEMYDFDAGLDEFVDGDEAADGGADA